MNADDIVCTLVALSGGKVVGRTRLQKEAYLLDRCGANFEIPFSYHHYGPYSFELANGWTDAAADKRITIREKTGRHGVPYSIFRLKDKSVENSLSLGGLGSEDAQDKLEKMGRVSDIVLELAATIALLWQKGYGEQAVEEVVTRKPLKARSERVAKALELLRELELSDQAATR